MLPDYGNGIYRREIRVCVTPATPDTPGRAVGELVDDFHHFRATLLHDGDTVRDARGEALRHPWTACAGAVDPLRRLVGVRLEDSLRAAPRHTPSKLQCTHLFDAAALAIAGAARAAGDRHYRVEIPDRDPGGVTHARLWCDGALVLEWTVCWNDITAPEPFAGRSLRGGRLAAWAASVLAGDRLEAVMVLQRACAISMGRYFDLEGAATAADVARAPFGACHAYQPERVHEAARMQGSLRDFTEAPDLAAEFARFPSEES